MNEISANVDFSAAVIAHPVLLDRGRYARLLTPYLNRFPRERIKVLFYEDLERDPMAFAAELAEFLGVPLDFDLQVVQRMEPKGKGVHSQWLNRTIRGFKATVDDLATRFGVEEGWNGWKNRHVSVYERALDLTHRRQEIDPDCRLGLVSEFSDDIAFIEQITGRELKHWHV